MAKKYDPLQATINALIDGALPLAEVARLLETGGLLVRANALHCLVALDAPQRERIALIVAAAKNPVNAGRLMGATTVAHEGIACLYRIGTPEAILAAEKLLSSWPEPDRGELLWYLRSEKLMPMELAKTG